jgi:hypothetical protein
MFMTIRPVFIFTVAKFSFISFLAQRAFPQLSAGWWRWILVGVGAGLVVLFLDIMVDMVNQT